MSNQKSQSLFVEFFRQLLVSDSSHFEDWFRTESIVPAEVPQFQSKLSSKIKKKNNFIVLLDLFLANEQHCWLFMLLLSLIEHVKETYISSIQSTKMPGKFDFIFKLLGLDIFFPNAYNFLAFVRFLLGNLDDQEEQSFYVQLKVELLNIVTIYALYLTILF